MVKETSVISWLRPHGAEQHLWMHNMSSCGALKWKVHDLHSVVQMNSNHKEHHDLCFL